MQGAKFLSEIKKNQSCSNKWLLFKKQKISDNVLKMNATNYYVSTTRLVLQGDPDTPSTWQDLNRMLPTLRNSLSCTVCNLLLVEPYTPDETSCEHHVCKSCKGGVKTLRPTCSWCKDYTKYNENVQLRILIQVGKWLKFLIIIICYCSIRITRNCAG